MKKDKQTDSLYFWNTASEFLNYYLPDIRHSSPNTAESYRCSLNHYINYLEIERKINRKEVSFMHFGREYIKEYMSWMNKTKGLEPKTCNLRLTAIHSLMEYASSESADLMALYLESRSIKGIKTPRKPIEFFEKNAMSALMNAPDITKKTERRNQMMLIFLYDTAARVSEMINTRVCDLHFDASISYVTLYGKGRKYRNIPLMDKTQEHLKKYLVEFHKYDNTDIPLFYVITHGEKHKLSVDTLEKMLKRYAIKCSSSGTTIPEQVHCHMIRKTRAMDLYQEGIPLTHIQQLLGHENLSTTSGFYAFATLATLAESLKKANPTEAKKKWKDKDVLDKIYKL
jgi:site-specific recombinase XerD